MYKSFTLNGEYFPIPSRCEVPKDAKNIKEYDSLAKLKASAAYKNYVAANKIETGLTREQLRKKVLKAQYEMGVDENLYPVLIAAKGKLETLPPETEKALTWLKKLWDDKYHNAVEPYSLDLSDVEKLEVSFKTIKEELGF